MLPESNTDTQPLDIFEIPSRVNILFILTIGILVLTLLGSVFLEAGLQCGLGLPLLIAALVIYDWFTGTDRQLRRYNFMRPSENGYVLTRQAIQRLSAQIGLKRVPEMVITATHHGFLAAFGNAHRAYIGASKRLAEALEEDLGSERRSPITEAVLLHELNHFKSGDVWRIMLVESSLRQVASFAFWFITIGMAVVLLAFGVTDVEYMLSDDFRAKLEAELPGMEGLIPTLPEEEIQKRLDNPVTPGMGIMFIFQAFAPLLISSGFLWIFFLRPMHQIREFYADAQAARQLNSQSMRRALGSYSFYMGLDMPSRPPSLIERVQTWLEDFWKRLVNPPTPPTHFIHQWLTRFCGFFQEIIVLHPDLLTRTRSLTNPWLLFRNPWWLVVTTGLLMVLIELQISGPFTTGLLFDFSGAIPLLIGFLALALNTWPVFADQQDWAAPRQQILIPLFTAFIWFIPLLFVVLLLTFMLLVLPADLEYLLEASVSIYATHLGGLVDVFASFGEVQAFVISAIIFQFYRLAVLFSALYVGLFLFRKVIRRVLRWPSSSRARRTLFWVIPISVGTGLAAIHMILNGLLFPDMYDLAAPTFYLPTSLLVITTIAGLGAFALLDRQHQGRVA